MLRLFSRISMPVRAPVRIVLGLISVGLLMCAALVRLFVTAIPEFDKATLLAHTSKVAVAQISHIDDISDTGARTIEYTYRVDLTTYRGHADNITNLDHLDVRYLASDPSYSAFDTDANARDARFRVFWILLALTALGGFEILLGAKLVGKPDPGTNA